MDEDITLSENEIENSSSELEEEVISTEDNNNDSSSSVDNNSEENDDTINNSSESDNNTDSTDDNNRDGDDGYGDSENDDEEPVPDPEELPYREIEPEDLVLTTTVIDTSTDAHCLEIREEDLEYNDIAIEKSGGTDSYELANSRGTNSAVIIENNVSSILTGSYIHSNGECANGIFVYDDETQINVSGTLIETYGQESNAIRINSGLAVLEDTTIKTGGTNSSPVKIETGSASLDKCYLITSGEYSPGLYINSNSDITVTDSYIRSSFSSLLYMDGNTNANISNTDMVLDNLIDEYIEDNRAAFILINTDEDIIDTPIDEITISGGSIQNFADIIFLIKGITGTINLRDNIYIDSNRIIPATEDSEEEDTTVNSILLVVASIVNIIPENNTNNEDDEEDVVLGDGEEQEDEPEYETIGSTGNLNLTSQNVDGDIFVEPNSVLNFDLAEDSTYTGDIYLEGTSNSTITMDSSNIIGNIHGDPIGITVNLTVGNGSTYTGNITPESNSNVYLTVSENSEFTGNIISSEDTSIELTLTGNSVYTGDIHLSDNATLLLNIESSSVFAGNIITDSGSVTTISISGNSSLEGAINTNNAEGAVISVTIEEDSAWSLTGDSYVSVLEKANYDCIVVNENTLYIDGERYVPPAPPEPEPPGPEPPEPEPPEPEDGRYDDIDYFFEEPRVLKVIKSSQLPAKAERDHKDIYFVYDKQRLIIYQSVYIDPFCIMDDVPPDNDLVENMLYITLHGYVFTYTDYTVKKIGHVQYAPEYDPDQPPEETIIPDENTDEENTDDIIVGSTGEEFDPDMMDILKSFCKFGFMNAEGRYIDHETRTLQLPFQHGDYQLALSLKEEIKINENTVIKYDIDSEQWKIYGDFEETELADIGLYKGYKTDTVESKVEDGIIKGRVRVSGLEGNGIRVYHNGLYINTSNKAEKEDFENLVEEVKSYKAIIDAYIVQIRDAIYKITQGMSKEAIQNEIEKTLIEYEPTILNMFSKYENIKSRIEQLEYDTTYALEVKIEEAKQEFVDYLNSIADPWREFERDTYPPSSDLSPDEYAVLGALLTNLRRQIMTLRAIEDKEIVILDDISELPAEEDENKIFYIWDSVNRTYTNYVWDEDNSTYIAGETTDPYAEPEAAPEPEPEEIVGANGGINVDGKQNSQINNISSGDRDNQYNSETSSETILGSDPGELQESGDETGDGEEDSGDDSGGSSDSDSSIYNSATGLTDDEEAVLNTANSNYSNTYYSTRNLSIYSSKDDFPESGDSRSYYVINFSDNKRLVFNPDTNLYEEYIISVGSHSEKTGVTVNALNDYTTHNCYQIYQWVYPVYSDEPIEIIDPDTGEISYEYEVLEEGYYDLIFSLYNTIEE